MAGELKGNFLKLTNSDMQISLDKVANERKRTAVENEKFQKIFDFFDKDKNGTLSQDEIADLMEKITSSAMKNGNMDVEDDEIRELLENATNADGKTLLDEGIDVNELFGFVKTLEADEINAADSADEIIDVAEPDATVDDNGNEVTDYCEGDVITKRVIKSTDEQGNVTETTLELQEGKVVKKQITKNGNTVATSAYQYNDENGFEYVSINTQNSSGANERTNVLEVDNYGNYTADSFIDRNTNTANGVNVDVYNSFGVLNEETSDVMGRTVHTIYNGNSVEEYDNNQLNRIYQRVDENGTAYSVKYDGEGNTLTTVNAGDGWERLAKRFGVTVDELKAMNPDTKNLKAGQRIIIPGEIDADSKGLQRTQNPAYAKHLGNRAEMEVQYTKNIGLNRNQMNLLNDAGFQINQENKMFFERIKDLPTSTKVSVVKAIQMYKEQGITDKNELKAKILEHFNINLFDSDKTISQDKYSQCRNAVALEMFLINNLGLDLNSEDGKKIYQRLASLPQEELNKISARDFILQEGDNNDFNTIAQRLNTVGVNIMTDVELRAKEQEKFYREQREGISAQRFASAALADMYETAANSLEYYYNNHGVFDFGTYYEGLKNILGWATPDKVFGRDARNTPQVINDLRAQSDKFKNMHADNVHQFAREFQEMTGVEYSRKDVEAFMQLCAENEQELIARYEKMSQTDSEKAQQEYFRAKTEFQNSDKYQALQYKAFGTNVHVPLDIAQEYAETGQMIGGVGDIAVMIMTLGASSGLKVVGKGSQLAFRGIERGVGKIISKKAAQKTAQIGTSMLMGGATMAGFTAIKETGNNLTNQTRDVLDWDTWKQTGIATLESFGMGAAGGLINTTAVAAVVRGIEKPAAKVVQSVTKAFSESSELTGKQVMQAAMRSGGMNLDGIFKMSADELKGLLRTVVAKGTGFGVEVSGFTVYESMLDVVKDLINPETGHLPEEMTVESLAQYLGNKFGEQLEGLGTIKGMSKLIMMCMGGKNAQKSIMAEMVDNSRLTDIKFRKVELNGREIYEVTTPDGKRSVVSSIEEVYTLSNMAMQTDFATKALSESEDVNKETATRTQNLTSNNVIRYEKRTIDGQEMEFAVERGAEGRETVDMTRARVKNANGEYEWVDLRVENGFASETAGSSRTSEKADGNDLTAENKEFIDNCTSQIKQAVFTGEESEILPILKTIKPEDRELFAVWCKICSKRSADQKANYNGNNKDYINYLENLESFNNTPELREVLKKNPELISQLYNGTLSGVITSIKNSTIDELGHVARVYSKIDELNIRDQSLVYRIKSLVYTKPILIEKFLNRGYDYDTIIDLASRNILPDEVMSQLIDIELDTENGKPQIWTKSDLREIRDNADKVIELSKITIKNKDGKEVPLFRNKYVLMDLVYNDIKIENIQKTIDDILKIDSGFDIANMDKNLLIDITYYNNSPVYVKNVLELYKLKAKDGKTPLLDNNDILEYARNNSSIAEYLTITRTTNKGKVKTFSPEQIKKMQESNVDVERLKMLANETYIDNKGDIIPRFDIDDLHELSIVDDVTISKLKNLKWIDGTPLLNGREIAALNNCKDINKAIDILNVRIMRKDGQKHIAVDDVVKFVNSGHDAKDIQRLFDIKWNDDNTSILGVDHVLKLLNSDIDINTIEKLFGLRGINQNGGEQAFGVYQIIKLAQKNFIDIYELYSLQYTDNKGISHKRLTLNDIVNLSDYSVSDVIKLADQKWHDDGTPLLDGSQINELLSFGNIDKIDRLLNIRTIEENGETRLSNNAIKNKLENNISIDNIEKLANHKFTALNGKEVTFTIDEISKFADYDADVVIKTRQYILNNCLKFPNSVGIFTLESNAHSYAKEKGNSDLALHYLKLYQYYSELTDKNGNKIFDGRNGRMDESEVLNYMASLPEISPEATAMRMLTSIVQDGQVEAHVLKYLPKEGHINPLIAEDVRLFYDAYLNGIDLNDVMVPTFNSNSAAANVKTGDVFEVVGERNIYIKNSDGTATQLKMDKATYCKLFPPIERYATTQNAIGNCWQITGFNGIMRDPSERLSVLETIEQDGNDIVIRFQNGKLETRFANGELPQGADPKYYSQGALGINLLEYAQGREMQYEVIQQKIKELNVYIKTAPNDAMRLKYIDELAELTKQGENILYKYDEGDYRADNRNIFDFASTSFRDGGCSNFTWDLLGYNNSEDIAFDYFDVRNFLAKPETFKKHLVGWASDGKGEKDVLKSKSISSGHAYWLKPNIDENATIKDYDILNPWGITEVTLTLDEVLRYGKAIYKADRKQR